MPDENALNIYTDGSSLPSPRAGGIGIRFIFPEFIQRSDMVKDFNFQGYKGATNNQMELQACITALEETRELAELRQIQRIIIHTDSSYVVNFNKIATHVWSRSKWLKQNGDPVLNALLWKKLISEVRKIGKPVDFEWVKGHDKNEHNKAVDRLAKKSAKKPTSKLPGHINLRRKQTSKKLELGSVQMLGQKISIRIITSEYLPIQKMYKYKYEVISKKSPFYSCVDIAYSSEALRAAHTFLVKFVQSGGQHRIEKIYRDLTKKRN